MKTINDILPYRSWICMIAGLIMLIAAAVDVNGQSRESTRLRSYFFIHPNGDRQISVLLTAGRGRNMQNVANAPISFEIDLGDSTQFITEVLTNADGSADLYVESGYTLPMDEEGLTTFLASFAGNDTLSEASTDLEIKDVFLELKFELKDSVKILSVLATEYNGVGESVPVEGLDVNIGVQRLYSILPVDIIETDDGGVATLEFPDGIPGDSVGAITILARVMEHDNYGTVTKKGSINWGLPVSYDLKKLPRQLFTDEAPLWMIIAVFIVLVGAWYHFFLSIFKLSKIKKIGMKE